MTHHYDSSQRSAQTHSDVGFSVGGHCFYGCRIADPRCCCPNQPTFSKPRVYERRWHCIRRETASLAKKKERNQGLGFSPCGCETNAECAMHLLRTPKLSWTHARRGLGDMLTSRIGQLWLVWPCVWANSTVRDNSVKSFPQPTLVSLALRLGVQYVTTLSRVSATNFGIFLLTRGPWWGAAEMLPHRCPLGGRYVLHNRA